ncbi:uncharacterized protein LOC129921847 [Biomphalaria glabrata]|uniref:Uncharacterized protein LOC129921847 n=1 Tax=Biomphalaria glabrata TaxID=6526 RepID=A0A9W2YE82_BIOGL|nr:uncharacterized protein LOC129921847 [Biomphalaria glabrata]
MEGNMVEPSSVKGRDVGPMCSGGEPEGMECVTKGMSTRLQAELEALKLACQRPHYIIEPARKIRHFSGEGRNDEVSIEDFVRGIRDLWELRPYLSPQEKTATIIANISGPARVEVDLQPPHIRSNPEALLDALTSAFEVIIPVREAEIAFLMSQQRRSESLLEFSHRLFKEFTTAIRQEKREGIDCFKEERLRDQYAYGVRDPELRRELFRFIVQHPQISFQSLRNYAFKLENQNKDAARAQEQWSEVLLAKLAKLEKQLEEIKGSGYNILLSSTNANSLSSQQHQGSGYNSLPSSTNPLSSQPHSQRRPTQRHTKHSNQNRIRPTAPPGLVWSRTKRGFFPYTDDGSPVCTQCWEVGHVRRHCQQSPQLTAEVQSVSNSEPIVSQPTHQVEQRTNEQQADAMYNTDASHSIQTSRNRNFNSGQPNKNRHNRVRRPDRQRRNYKHFNQPQRRFRSLLPITLSTASQTLWIEEDRPLCMTDGTSTLQTGKVLVVPEDTDKKQLFRFSETY